MKILVGALAIYFMWVPVASAKTDFGGATYLPATIVTVQEALIRLGYEVGKADGKWSPKTRDALNDLRAKNGLPNADTLTGSSLALVHRVSPGPATLPHPGLIVTDVVARRAFLQSNPFLANALCPYPYGMEPRLSLPAAASQPVKSVTVTRRCSTKGCFGGDDWYSAYLEATTSAQIACVAGNTPGCENIVGLVQSWAKADALKPGVTRGSPSYETTFWTGNVLLKSLMVAFVHARSFVDVPPQDEAVVQDWFKRRVDEYTDAKFPQRGVALGDPEYYPSQNHALADQMPALAFGVWAGDRSMLQPAFDAWRTIFLSQREDGSLPGETRRGAKAIIYSAQSIAQLLAVAKIAEAQGIDLFATLPPDKSMQKAVAYLLDALEDFDKISGYARANAGAGQYKDYKIPVFDEGWVFGWLSAYAERFPDDANLVRMRSLIIDPRICSKKAIEDEKIKEKICQSRAGRPLTFGELVRQIEYEPSHFMGYPASCLQGTKVFGFTKF